MATKARPIIFDAESVRAILAGRKTHTRRLINPAPPEQPAPDCHPRHEARHKAPYLDAYCSQPKTEENPRGKSESWCWWQVDDRQCLPQFRCPFGQPGDQLWVRETWGESMDDYGGTHVCFLANDTCALVGWTEQRGDHLVHAPEDRVDPHDDPEGISRGVWVPERWSSPIHMPRWVSRLTIRIIDVRVERVQQISGDDIMAEGYRQREDASQTGLKWWSSRWDQINGVRAPWDANPWVWVLEFERVSDDGVRP